MLTKKISYDYTIAERKAIHIRKIIRIIEDGKTLSRTYERRVVEPGANTDNESVELKALAELIHTPEVQAEYIRLNDKKKQDVKDDNIRRVE